MRKADLDVITPDNFEVFEREALSDIKLTESKVVTLHRILSIWHELPNDWKNLSEEEVRSALKEIKGIGPWTIDMILLYTLELPDIFPADDYHLKIIMTQLYQLDPNSRLKSQMKEVAEKWSPYRSLATRYLLEWKKFNQLK